MRTNLPLSNSTKIIYDFNHLNGDVAFANFTIQKYDVQEKQKYQTF